MGAPPELCLVIGLLILAVIMTIVVTRWARHKRDTFAPYGLGLYDSPRYYPHYQSRDWAEWDADGRCITTCRDDGCVQVCQ